MRLIKFHKLLVDLWWIYTIVYSHKLAHIKKHKH